MARAIVAAVVTLAVSAGPVAAVPDPARLKLGHHATILNGGAAVSVTIKARCEPGWDVLEAFLFVSQDAAFVETGFGLPCDGRWHRTVVRGVSLDAPFVEGEASFSAFLLVIDGAENTAQAQDTAVLRL
jgi:hypothetical protein